MNLRAFGNPALWLFSGLVFLGTPARCSTEKPLIAVQFKIEAPEFRANLAKVLTKIESGLTSDLVNHFNKRFGFYEWTSEADLKDSSRLAAFLTISLARGDRGVPDWNIFLVFATNIQKNGAVFDCLTREPKPPDPGPFLTVDLYSGSNTQPTGKANRLIEDIKIRIMSPTKDQELERSLALSFFNHIPFYRDAKPLARLIAIPLSKDELPAERGSRMDLTLCARPPGELLGRGKIGLTLTDESVGEGPFANMLQAEYDPPHFPSLSKDYEIRVLFDNALKPSLGLFMVTFHQRPPHTSPVHATKSTP
jgi:hypothetical protein